MTAATTPTVPIVSCLPSAQCKNKRDLVKTITVPTLVVHGAGDLLLPPAKGRETADLIPGATFKLIAGVGHDIPPGLGKPLTEIVLEHIQSITNVSTET